MSTPVEYFVAALSKVCEVCHKVMSQDHNISVVGICLQLGSS